ncbi:hypothetical protein BJ878DRAFT_426183 [Calycina marina]|uniref:Uncharacterized protein n=1 Tax=Calycina marina TaxID=1763456 RepID=A0A9P7YYJ4_9HELO|nr:hypothetical protein BJ878DRAFT_426183 [Calycina marina]
MPGLTVETSSTSSTLQSPAPSFPFPSTSHAHRRSASPGRPPVSPLTPPLPAQNVAPRQTYTHWQSPQTAIPLPAPAPINLDENPDAMALRSAIAILQMQARRAEDDMNTLGRIKKKALENPQEFARALKNGEITSAGDGLFDPLPLEENEDEDDEDEEINGGESSGKQKEAPKKEKWEKIPKSQKIVKMPPINWEKYAVMGESLDKLHEDQKMKPNEGKPQILGPDGKLRYGGDAPRRMYEGVAAPYTPKNKVNKKKR